MQAVSPQPAIHGHHAGAGSGQSAPLEQLAYCSIVVNEIHAMSLMQLMHEAGLADATADITGLLIWDDRLMIHWLEGPQDVLTSLWGHIQNDPRQHCLVPLLHKRGVACRLFEAWRSRPASRSEMMAIVRQAKEQASKDADPQTQQWQHAISTLSIVLDPDLTDFYAQAARPKAA